MVVVPVISKDSTNVALNKNPSVCCKGRMQKQCLLRFLTHEGRCSQLAKHKNHWTADYGINLHNFLERILMWTSILPLPIDVAF